MLPWRENAAYGRIPMDIECPAIDEMEPYGQCDGVETFRGSLIAAPLQNEVLKALVESDW